MIRGARGDIFFMKVLFLRHPIIWQEKDGYEKDGELESSFEEAYTLRRSLRFLLEDDNFR